MPATASAPVGVVEPSGGSEDTTPKSQRTRKTREIVSVKTLAETFQLASVPLHLSGYGRYAPTDAECTALAEVWVPVLTLYPQVAKQLIAGRRLTVWGRACVTTYFVFAPKFIADAQAKATAKQPERTEQRVQQTNETLRQSPNGTNGVAVESDVVLSPVSAINPSLYNRDAS